MQKKCLFFVITILVVLCSFSQDRIDKTGKKLAKLFAQRVTQHNVVGTLALLDGAFKQIQLIGVFGNDTMAFLNDLFCGQVKGQPTVTCGKFHDIELCKFREVGKFTQQEEKFAMATVFFTIRLKNGTNFDVQFYMVRYPNKGKKKYLYRLAGQVG